MLPWDVGPSQHLPQPKQRLFVRLCLPPALPSHLRGPAGQLRSLGPPRPGLLQGLQYGAVGSGPLFGCGVGPGPVARVGAGSGKSGGCRRQRAVSAGAATSRKSQALSGVPGPCFHPDIHSVSERWEWSNTKEGRGTGD